MDLTEKFLQFALVGANWVLWLLVGLSVVSVYIMLERFIFFRQITGADAGIRRGLLTALADHDLAKARKLVTGVAGSGARMVAEMLENKPRGHAAMEAAMNGVRSEEKLRLERNLSYIGTVGANAPFIGLFGTVLGIIRAFHDLSGNTMQGTQAVMSGIAEALVATGIGLLVALPAVATYNIFIRLTEAAAAGSERTAHQILAHLKTPRGPEA